MRGKRVGKQGRTGRARAASGAAGPAPRSRPALALGVLAVFLVLCGTAEERTLGTITDELQMLNTGISLVETGGLGIARGQYFTILRPAGDALAPYGMGLPLAFAPALSVAERWERAFGPSSSQTLLVLTQVLLVTLASALAGLLARAAGASPPGQVVAVLATGLGSPLWDYVASAYSEPLQAVCLAGAATAALTAVRSGRTATGVLVRAAVAGLCAGGAVLTKGVHLAIAPFALLPLLLDGPPRPARERAKLVAAAAAGAVPTLGAWLAFEIVRFGRPLASYAGQGFTHPPLDGLWRLLVGPNKGLLLYFPLLVLAAAGVVALLRDPRLRGAGLAVAGVFAALLATASAWFAWDGTCGWGPRLLLPVIPLLAAAAGVAASRGPLLLRTGAVLLAAGAAVNVLGVLQPEVTVFSYVAATPAVPLEGSQLRTFPTYYRCAGEHGEPAASRVFFCSSDAAFSPVRLAAFLLRARLSSSDPEEIRRRISIPPWDESRPGLRPDLATVGGGVTIQSIWNRVLTTPFVWPHLGRVLSVPVRERVLSFYPAFRTGLADQAARALDIGRPERAVRLAERLWDLAPTGYYAALKIEGLRLSGEPGEAVSYVDSLPPPVAEAPTVLLARALLARDAGNEGLARALLSAAGRGLGSSWEEAAQGKPLAAWPKRLRDYLLMGAEGYGIELKPRRG